LKLTDDDWCCEHCSLATDPKTGCMKAGYCRYRDGPPDLGPSDLPCREKMLPNYSNPVHYRGEITLMHEWFYDGRWHACDPRVCRQCQRNAKKACAETGPMA